MAARRYLVGGESNSSKSTFVLSLVKYLEESRGIAAEAIELDVWSNSHPAFRGEVDFAKRQKRFDLKWAWKRALNKRLHAFNTSRKAYVFGDMPGVLGKAVAHMCDKAKPDGVIVISKTERGLKDWVRLFRDDYGFTIVGQFLSIQAKSLPSFLPDMERHVDGKHPHVVNFGSALIRTQRGRTRRKRTKKRTKKA